jgi:hypothetical protein
MRVQPLACALKHDIQKTDAALSDHLLGPFIEWPIVTARGGNANRLKGAARLLRSMSKPA